MGVDLMLGSDIGLWALGRTPAESIDRVFTFDRAVVDACVGRGINVITDSINVYEGACAGVGLSVHYPRVLNAAALGRYDRVYNLHPGLLPYGRGWYPIFWALWEGTPAGATLHLMVPAVDEGPIVDQIEVRVRASDTGGSLLTRVRAAQMRLLDHYVEHICASEALDVTPQQGAGSSHTRAEFFAVRDHVDVGQMSSGDLLRLIRALTVPDLPGLRVALGGEAFRLVVQPDRDSSA